MDAGTQYNQPAGIREGGASKGMRKNVEMELIKGDQFPEGDPRHAKVFPYKHHRKRSIASSGCLIRLGDVRNELVVRARKAAPVRSVRTHTVQKGDKAGTTFSRRTDVRIGKGVIDGISGLVKNGHCSGAQAMRVLNSTVSHWASTYQATNTPKVAGRSTIKYAHFQKAVEHEGLSHALKPLSMSH